MCGIVGGFASGVKPEEIKSMVGALKHRGPDDDGFFIDEDIFLGHTRLSIIDLSEAGSQPMSLVVEGKEFCIILVR